MMFARVNVVVAPHQHLATCSLDIVYWCCGPMCAPREWYLVYLGAVDGSSVMSKVPLMALGVMSKVPLMAQV